MENTTSFKIFSASAGSGKTFNLVKQYLGLLLSTKNAVQFRNILALTFTNKAVGEMKERIIEALQQFSSKKVLEERPDLFLTMMEDLELSDLELHNRSIIVLRNILHNYAAFDVSTIDKFNHRLIRTFANDLKLPVNFEVELDTDYILNKAVDNLIDKAGTDKQLTKLLVDFAIEKVDEDKSWDVSYDLNQVAKIITNENDRKYLERIQGKNLNDFQNLKTNLIEKITSLEGNLVSIANEVLDKIQQSGLEHSDFTRSTLPTHFSRISVLSLDRLYDNKLEENLSDGTGIYNKGLDEGAKQTIDQLLPYFEERFLILKKAVHEVKLLKNALKHITPLSVLNAINTSLREITTDEELVLISDFNSLINNEIKDQPAPYIYERIGERYQHYFIDEFQDTSELQWNNLVPMIGNSLSQINLDGHTGSAMLVGDAKQAIYRWRGGRAEQFINLYSGQESPFTIERTAYNLPKNYRSHGNIVNFNNSFFKFLSERSFSEISHSELFLKSFQETTNDKTGFIGMSFIDSSLDKEEKEEEYSKETYFKIKEAIENGFDYKDICIITRKRKESIAIATYLSDEDVPIISSESLLLKNSPEVQFLISLLILVSDPQNHESKIEILSYLAEYKFKIEDKHQFFEENIFKSTKMFFEEFSNYGFKIDHEELLNLPLYETAESLVRAFRFDETSNAYIQFFLDEIFNLTQRDVLGINGFLDYWNQKMEKLSVISPQGSNAVELMTIHKAKGLEFPVVIFPFANQDIYSDINPKMWVEVEPSEFSGFQYLYIGLNKDLENMDGGARQGYLDYKSQQELDSLNLLYVVMTRPVKELHIISELDVSAKGETKPNLYSGLFIDYLKSIGKWEDGKSEYQFGTRNKEVSEKEVSYEEEYLNLISTARKDINLNILSRSGRLWDTEQEAAIEKGDLLHFILSKIDYAQDARRVVEELKNYGELSEQQEEVILPILDAIVFHPRLKKYYSEEYTILNERDIISASGQSFRPDRVMIRGKEAGIIDYKTGREMSKHSDQINLYGQLLEDMGFKVSAKIVLYINEEIQIKEL
ncbi:ATP-dependent exoDNAse (exonuclease V) beta subunit (contains helicase and exonuclease domains) [Flavobacteriaceae bacterium MAR_2010_188]|nr:ATP-dependent exoDNAse (exonuclease V) beta subunit (contains helicase and exonuclease domains) [Flavobacteriaceae bacterium MAR_2010_188]